MVWYFVKGYAPTRNLELAFNQMLYERWKEGTKKSRVFRIEGEDQKRRVKKFVGCKILIRYRKDHESNMPISREEARLWRFPPPKTKYEVEYRKDQYFRKLFEQPIY
jgi:hypothetical protein